MKNIPSFLNQRKDFVLFLVVCLLFLGYSFLSSQPKYKKNVTNPAFINLNPIPITPIKDQPIISVDSSLQIPNLKSEMPVYTSQYQKISVYDVADAISSQYHLQPVPNVKNHWANEKTGQIISLNTDYPNVSYLIDKITNSSAYSEGKIPDVKGAEKNASEFISILPSPIVKSINIQKPEISYLNIDYVGDPAPGTPEKFNLIQFNYYQYVSEYPIQINDSEDPVVSVYIGQNNQIVKAVVYPTLVIANTESFINYPVYTSEEIINSIRNNSVGITRWDTSEVFDLATEKISKAKIVGSPLQRYRFNTNNNLLIPYINFRAEVTFKSGLIAPVSVILPLVNIKPTPTP